MSNQFHRSSSTGIQLPTGWKITSRLMAGWPVDGQHQLELLPAALDGQGRARWHYRLSHTNKTIFEGDDFSSNVGTKIETNSIARAALGLLAFLTLRPGDTDTDYFDAYTPEQIAWRDIYAEDLSLYAMDDLCGYCGSEGHISPVCPVR